EQQLRLALWRLDSFVAPAIAKEKNRPYYQYSAVYAPSLALQNDGNAWQPGKVLEVSPLVSEELPDWMLLHFRTTVEGPQGWDSPQVLSKSLVRRLAESEIAFQPSNATPERERLRAELANHLPRHKLLQLVREGGTQVGEEDYLVVPADNT